MPGCADLHGAAAHSSRLPTDQTMPTNCSSCCKHLPEAYGHMGGSQNSTKRWQNWQASAWRVCHDHLHIVRHAPHVQARPAPMPNRAVAAAARAVAAVERQCGVSIVHTRRGAGAGRAVRWAIGYHLDARTPLVLHQVLAATPAVTGTAVWQRLRMARRTPRMLYALLPLLHPRD